MLVVVALVGAIGYHTLGAGRWRFSDCLYMSIITLSTVGFAETLPDMDQVEWSRAWTVVLILLGSGTLVYFGSTLTALLVEGDLQGVIRRRRMNRLLEGQSGHIIIAGVGSTGFHVAAELTASGTPFVVIDRDEDRIERAVVTFGRDLLYVVGDATDDAVLDLAGVRRAAGLIAALTDDRDNLFVVVTARSLTESLRIVSKAVDNDNILKLERGGADVVVAPALIGGVRMASVMVRPSVVQFLDGMVRGRDREERRIEEVVITPDSPIAGRALHEAGLREALDVLVIAVRDAAGHHEYNPPANRVLEVGNVLIVLVKVEDVAELRRVVSGRATQ